MSEHNSFKECKWFAANYRENHSEYQSSSSKHNSRIPKSLSPGTNLCTTFHAEQECLQEFQSHLQMVQKKTPVSWKRTGHSWNQHIHTLHLCTMPPRLAQFLTKLRLLSNHKQHCLKLQPCILSLLHLLYFACNILPSNIPNNLFYLLSFFPQLEGTSPFRCFFNRLIITTVSETRKGPTPLKEFDNCLLSIFWYNILLFIFKCVLLPIMRIPPIPKKSTWFFNT